MRGLLLVAVITLAGCTAFEGGGAAPPEESLTIGFLPTNELPMDSTGGTGPAYSTGVTLSCTVGEYIAFHAAVSSDNGPSPVGLSISKVDAAGNETAVGSPIPMTVAASEPPPYGLNVFIYEPMSVAELCATLGAGNFRARIIAPDGGILASGHFSIMP